MQIEIMVKASLYHLIYLMESQDLFFTKVALEIDHKRENILVVETVREIWKPLVLSLWELTFHLSEINRLL